MIRFIPIFEKKDLVPGKFYDFNQERTYNVQTIFKTLEDAQVNNVESVIHETRNMQPFFLVGISRSPVFKQKYGLILQIIYRDFTGFMFVENCYKLRVLEEIPDYPELARKVSEWPFFSRANSSLWHPGMRLFQESSMLRLTLETPS